MMQPRPVVLQGMQVRRLPMDMPEVRLKASISSKRMFHFTILLIVLMFFLFVVRPRSRIPSRIPGEHADD